MKTLRILLFTLLFPVVLPACRDAGQEPPGAVSGEAPEPELIQTLPEAEKEVLPGVEVLARDYAGELQGLRVGILTNPTGVTRQLESTIDVVRELPGVEVVRLFSPEHGLRGQFFAGDKVSDMRDPVSDLPVVSLYGATRKPTAEMLEGLDVVLYDIQDVGHRTYTYVSTLTYLMEACEEAGVAVWVLDRPDPMGGLKVGGPVIDSDLLSFIGIHEVPQVYGMTPGEWARMIQAERTPDVDLRVIPMDGWRRGMDYGDLGWIWIPPSQHIPHWESAYFYAMTGTIGELRRLSEGVGTPAPFQLIGAPWLDGQAFARRLNAADLPGVIFRPTSFKPRYGTGSGELMQGVQIHVRDYDAVDPAGTGLALMAALVEQAPEQDVFADFVKEDGSTTGYLKALGSRELAEELAANRPPVISDEQQARLRAFLERREQYLLYEQAP
jgi:uncharacterized protein YbbC (DUF1343 family)